MRNGVGQTLAEFALVLPIFLLIVLGLFDVGRAVFVYNGLTNAVREGARLAVVNQDKDSIARRAQAMAFGTELDTDADAMTSFWNRAKTDECPDGDLAVGCIAVVEATTTWQAITPVIGNFIGPIELSARSEMPIEFECPNPNNGAYLNVDTCPKQQP